MTAQSRSHSHIQSHILITGASSGIGAALALNYARSGTHLILWGRNQERLEQIAKKAQQHGASTETHVIDLNNTNHALECLQHIDSDHPIDICIFAAGISDIRPETELTELPHIVQNIACVNFSTPITLATEMAKRMAIRKSGNIALIGSVAAFHDLPMASAYSGSKAGLARFSTALHAAMKPHNVFVTLISPGYVDTPMSQRLVGARPFLVSPQKAARLISKAIGQGRAHLLFPRIFFITKVLEYLMPRSITHRLLRIANVKQNPSTLK
ncbi:SDR family NAD(P)-dependent oxidoreductase [Swingsia samuiensis]|nr:SDR family NAD(P)-dependent oxidoreductase [Swingsia samuiensis]